MSETKLGFRMEIVEFETDLNCTEAMKPLRDQRPSRRLRRIVSFQTSLYPNILMLLHRVDVTVRTHPPKQLGDIHG